MPGTCLFGGAFDPPHRTHRRILEACVRQLPVDRVVVVPSGEHPFKERAATPAAIRLELCRLAFGGMPAVEISDFEVTRPGPSYTVETLRHFRTGMAPGEPLFWVIGADNLASLPQWREPEEIRRLCRLVVVPRAELHGGDSGADVLLDLEPDDVSSSRIRELLRAGVEPADLLDPAVRDRIAELGLYR